MEYSERKRLRLPCFDYSDNGAYFVTLCTKNRANVLSKIVGNDALVVPTAIGEKVLECLKNIENVYNGVTLDYYVIMPNHIHAIFFFNNISKQKCHLDLPKIMKDLKSVTTRFHKKYCGINESLWQNSYYDHIIRNKEDLFETRKYIENNPIRWICKD